MEPREAPLHGAGLMMKPPPSQLLDAILPVFGIPRLELGLGGQCARERPVFEWVAKRQGRGRHADNRGWRGDHLFVHVYVGARAAAGSGPCQSPVVRALSQVLRHGVVLPVLLAFYRIQTTQPFSATRVLYLCHWVSKDVVRQPIRLKPRGNDGDWRQAIYVGKMVDVDWRI